MEEEGDANVKSTANERVMNDILIISQKINFSIQRIFKNFFSLTQNSKEKVVYGNYDSGN